MTLARVCTGADETANRIMTLSDGRRVAIRRPKGRDLLEASRLAKLDPCRMPFELLGLLASTGGRPLGAHALLGLGLCDAAALLAEIRSEPGFLSSGPATFCSSRG